MPVGWSEWKWAQRQISLWQPRPQPLMPNQITVLWLSHERDRHLKKPSGGGGESPPSPILWSWEKEEERETKKNTGTTQRANEPNNLRNTTYVPVILNYAPRDIPIPASIFCEWQRKWHWDGQEKNIIRYDIHKAFHNAIDKYVHTKKKPETKFQSQIPSLETIKISRRLSPQRFIYDDDLRTFLQIPLNRTGIN